MKELYSDYDMHSYAVQKDVCRLRRDLNLPCRKCRYLEKCKTNHRIIDKLNNELNEYKPRYIY